MNKKATYALRLVLGAYLAYLGISLIIEMVQERPTNMILMCAMSVVFVIVGGGYAIYSLKKLLDIRKEEKGTAMSDELEEDEISPVSDNPNTVRQINMQSTEIKKVQNANTVKETSELPNGNMDTPADSGETPDADDENSQAETDLGEEKDKETLEEEIENDYEEK